MNFDLSDLSIAAHAYGAFLLLGFGGASMVFVHACLKRDTCSLFKSLKVYSGRRRPLLIAAFLLCGAFMGLVAGLCADPPAKVLLLPLAGGAWPGLLSLRSRLVSGVGKLFNSYWQAAQKPVTNPGPAIPEAQTP